MSSSRDYSPPRLAAPPLPDKESFWSAASSSAPSNAHAHTGSASGASRSGSATSGSRKRTEAGSRSESTPMHKPQAPMTMSSRAGYSYAQAQGEACAMPSSREQSGHAAAGTGLGAGTWHSGMAGATASASTGNDSATSIWSTRAAHRQPQATQVKDPGYGHSHSYSLSRPPLQTYKSSRTLSIGGDSTPFFGADGALLPPSGASNGATGAGAGAKVKCVPGVMNPSFVFQSPSMAYQSHFARSKGTLATDYGDDKDDSPGASSIFNLPVPAYYAATGDGAAAGYHKGGKSTSSPKDSQSCTNASARSLRAQSIFWWATALLQSSWISWLFMLVVLLEAGVNISVESVLLARFNTQKSIEMDVAKERALPVFLVVFGLAHLYQILLAIDAVVNKNMILVIGMLLMNGCMLVYSGIQIGEIRDVLGTGVVAGTGQHIPVQVLTGLIPGVVGAAEVAFGALFVPLWKEYGWRIYKQIGADRGLKRRYLHYQIYVALLKYDFFVFCAYCLQLILIVLQRMDAERIITIIAPLFSLLVLVLAWWAVRAENRVGMYAFMVGLTGALVYFSYKLLRIWQDKDGAYKEVYRSLSTFSILSILLLVITLGMTVRCLLNFGRGLRAAIERISTARKLGHRAMTSNGGTLYAVGAAGGADGKGGHGSSMLYMHHRLSID